MFFQSAEGDGHGGGEFLGEQRHAEFLDHPAELHQFGVAEVQLGVFLEAVEVGLPEDFDFAHVAVVAADVALLELLHADADGLEIAGEVGEPFVGGAGDEAVGHEVFELLVDVEKGGGPVGGVGAFEVEGDGVVAFHDLADKGDDLLGGGGEVGAAGVAAGGKIGGLADLGAVGEKGALGDGGDEIVAKFLGTADHGVMDA